MSPSKAESNGNIIIPLPYKSSKSYIRLIPKNNWIFISQISFFIVAKFCFRLLPYIKRLEHNHTWNQHSTILFPEFVTWTIQGVETNDKKRSSVYYFTKNLHLKDNLLNTIER